ETSGSFMYPVAIFQQGVVQYIPLWQYLLITLALSMVLSYVLFLITTGFSWIFRNFYLTIILTSMLFILPQICNVVPAFSSWQPSLYLNIFGVLQGTTAAATGLSG